LLERVYLAKGLVLVVKPQLPAIMSHRVRNAFQRVKYKRRGKIQNVKEGKISMDNIAA
jgi:hypothetical protein